MTRNEFHTVWLRHFAKDISKNDIEKYIVATGNYLWHVFSWKLLDESAFLTGDSARKAYDRIDKHNALYIEWFEDEETNTVTINQSTADALDKMIEVYIIASDFSWTYIKTHESMCGPYFMKL